MAANDDPILRGPLFWILLRQGLPLAVGMASHVLFNLIDLLLVGRLGEAAVAGVHVATTINFLPMIVGNGVSVASMSMMSRKLGAGRVEEARDLSSRSQLLMIVLGVVLGLTGAALTVPCVDLQGVSGEARAIGIHYLLVCNLGTVSMFVLMQATASMRAWGEGLMPLVLLLGANFLNLVLDVVLLFGWPDLGIPAFGAPGAAYASVIARLLFGVAGLWWLSRSSNPLRFRFVTFRGPVGQRRQMLLLGLPQSLQMAVRAATVIALTRLASDLAGQSAVVALGVTTRLDTMVLFSAVGFASAGTAVVGRNVGAGLTERARQAGEVVSGMALCGGALLVFVFAVWARELVGFFVDGASEGVLAQGALYLQVAALGQPLAAFCLAATGGINGSGRMLPPMVLDLVGYLGLMLPVLVLLSVLGSGVELRTVWWTYAAMNLVLTLAYWAYLRRGAWPEGGEAAADLSA